MDCRIYLPDGQTVEINNIQNIRAIPKEDKLSIAVYNDEDKQPVAMFTNCLGYLLIGRPRVS